MTTPAKRPKRSGGRPATPRPPSPKPRPTREKSPRAAAGRKPAAAGGKSPASSARRRPTGAGGAPRPAARHADELSESFLSVLDDIPQPVFVWEVATLAILDANRAATSKYGWSREELRALTLLDLRPAHHVTELLRVLADPADGPWQPRVFRHRTRGGEEFDAEVVAYPLSYEGRAARLSMVRDVTEVRRAERQLRDRESHLRAVLDAALDAVIGMDESGAITYWNPSAEGMFGWSRSEAIGQSLADLVIPPALRDRHREGLRRFLATGAGSILNRRLELSGLRRDGREFPLDLMVTALRHGEHWTFNAFCTDLSARRQAEASVRLYADLVSHVPVGIVVVRVEDREDAEAVRVIARNPAMARVRGRGDGDVVGHRLHEFLPESEARVLGEFFIDIVKSGEPRDWRGASFEAPGQGPRTYDVRGFPLPDGCVGAVFDDVTERRAAEDSRARLAAIVESSDDAIVSVGLDNRVQSWNAGAERMFGYPAAEVIGREGGFLVPPHQTGQFEGAIEKLERGERFEVLDAVRLHRDGTPIEVTIILSPIRDAEGRLVGASAFLRDISEAKRVEAQRRSSEERYRHLFESAPVGVYQSTREGRLITANPELARILGYDSVEDLLECNAADLYADPAERDSLIAHYEPVGRVADLEVRWRMRDGTPIQVQLNARAIKDETGETLYFEGFVRDVTERLLLEEQLRHSQKMEAVGRLAGGIAHDFNNLLTAILGYSELALADAPGGSSLHSKIAEIHRAGERASNLTRQLLAFSRRQVLQPRLVDLNQVVGEVGGMLRRLLGDDIDLALRLEADLAPVRADPGQLEQVLVNLAVNARDAMPEGGTLTLETRNLEGRETDASAPGPRVRLAVHDTGVGMDPETLSRVFEPFFTTKGPGKGTGLGLSTVYGIVQQSGGQIRARSQPGVGTSFEIDLPRAREEDDAPPPAPEAEVGASAGPGTVLLAEDEPQVRDLARNMLEGEGFHVLTCANADEALARSRAHDGTIRLMLTDVVMPGTHVLEVVRILRHERPSMRIVYMSGYNEWTGRDEAALEGGALYVQKPFRREQLLRIIRGALNRAADSDKPNAV